MFYPISADATQEYTTRFVRNPNKELHASKRLRQDPSYRDYVVVAESWTQIGDFTLLRYPTIPASPPQIGGLLRSLRFVQRSRLLHNCITPGALNGSKLGDFSNAIDMASAVTHAKELFFPDSGPLDKRVLGLVAQDLLTQDALDELGACAYEKYLEMPAHEAVLDLLKYWKTWDLYELSALVEHPLAEKCCGLPAERPSLDACIAAL